MCIQNLNIPFLDPQCIVPPKTTFSDSDTKGHTPCHKERGRGKRMAECNSDVNENAGYVHVF